jgi:hypothetical protein
MCRLMRAAASPLPQTCERSNFHCNNDASAEALAFLLCRVNNMATKPGSNSKNEFVFFDVVYEDGSQRSNRRVPAELLSGLEKDEPARGFIIEQDREIAERSGRPPLSIKNIRRSGTKRTAGVKAK